MSSRTLNRKDFLVLTISSATIASFLEACGTSDPATTPTTGGSSGTGGSAAGTGGSAAGTTTTGGSASGSGGTGGSAAGTSGSGTGGSGGTAGGSGGSSGGGAGGGGAGGTSGAAGHGGGGAGGGAGGGGGGMCGTVSIMQTSNEMHDHIPDDPTMLKADLKMLINGNMATMAFTLPKDGMAPGHTHTLTFTMDEIMKLKSGMMITGKKSSMDSQHDHTYTIGCTA